MEKVIPFGPFLAAGALMTVFYGSDIISWYLGLIRL
jgi:prepilin signal peptidase PulO-like enzyme (type II secretory pathway)